MAWVSDRLTARRVRGRVRAAREREDDAGRGRSRPSLGLPLIAKDTIKQALMTVLPVPDVAASRVVGRASVAALLAVAAESGGAVLESVWHRSYALDDLRGLPGPVVEVFCRCDPALAAERYALRAGVAGTPVTSTPSG